jgi:hypothetical protein
MVGGFVVLALLGSACSDDDDDSSSGSDSSQSDDSSNDSASTASRDDYINAFVDGAADSGMTTDESKCIAGALVDTVSLDVLREKVTPDEIRQGGGNISEFGLSEEEAGGLVDAMGECADLRGLFLSSGGQQSPEFVTCLNGLIDDTTFRQYVVALFTSTDGTLPPDLKTRLTDAYNTCTAQTGGATPTTAGGS